MDRNTKILVIDDDENIRNTMKTILEDEGYLVDLAANGSEAIEKTQKTAYNIALLDIRLPDIEGVELLKLMKDPTPRTRKIMVTGYPSMQNAITALNKNADAYLIKPVNVEKLLKTIKDQLQLQEEERQFSEQKVVEFIDTRVKELITTS
ncbi:MAG: response regulator [Candidatus Bathyarchaeia archaeon]